MKWLYIRRDMWNGFDRDGKLAAQILRGPQGFGAYDLRPGAREFIGHRNIFDDARVLAEAAMEHPIKEPA